MLWLNRATPSAGRFRTLIGRQASPKARRTAPLPGAAEAQVMRVAGAVTTPATGASPRIRAILTVKLSRP
ncbi:hypothetical protein D3C81_1787030 [compost metagenome]